MRSARGGRERIRGEDRKAERERGEAAAHLLPVLAVTVSEGLRDDAAVAHSRSSGGDLFHCYDDSGGGGGAFENGEGLGKVASGRAAG